VLYRGSQFVEAVREVDDAAAYWVERTDTGVTETRLDTRRL
jgi:hypothetical protein